MHFRLGSLNYVQPDLSALTNIIMNLQKTIETLTLRLEKYENTGVPMATPQSTSWAGIAGANGSNGPDVHGARKRYQLNLPHLSSHPKQYQGKLYDPSKDRNNVAYFKDKSGDLNQNPDQKVQGAILS